MKINQQARVRDRNVVSQAQVDATAIEQPVPLHQRIQASGDHLHFVRSIIVDDRGVDAIDRSDDALVEELRKQEFEEKSSRSMTAAKLRISEDCVIAIQRGFVQYAETLGDVRSDGRGRWKMLCPLPDHADGNPSFAIFNGRNEIPMAKCSCGFSGGVIQLAQRLNPLLNYPEILRHLAAVIGVDIDMIKETDEQAKARRERATVS